MLIGAKGVSRFPGGMHDAPDGDAFLVALASRRRTEPGPQRMYVRTLVAERVIAPDAYATYACRLAERRPADAWWSNGETRCNYCLGRRILIDRRGRVASAHSRDVPIQLRACLQAFSKPSSHGRGENGSIRME